MPKQIHAVKRSGSGKTPRSRGRRSKSSDCACKNDRPWSPCMANGDNGRSKRSGEGKNKRDCKKFRENLPRIVGVYDPCCVCPRGFKDKYCNTDINECEAYSKLCLSGGKCVNTRGSYYCQCKYGFAGKHCEIKSSRLRPTQPTFVGGSRLRPTQPKFPAGGRLRPTQPTAPRIRPKLKLPYELGKCRYKGKYYNKGDFFTVKCHLNCACLSPYDRYHPNGGMICQPRCGEFTHIPKGCPLIKVDNKCCSIPDIRVPACAGAW